MTPRSPALLSAGHGDKGGALLSSTCQTGAVSGQAMCWVPRSVRAAIVILIMGLASACGGPTQETQTSGQASRLLAPASFATEVSKLETFTLNVHTPDQGSIAGTDMAVPFDQLRGRAIELPKDKTTPLAVYCRSGRMSATAVVTLASLGYTDVVELERGMEAWTADGRPLLLS